MLTAEERNIIWVNNFDFLSYVKKAKILSIFNIDDDVRLIFQTKRLQLLTFLSQKEYDKMTLHLSDEEFYKLIDYYAINNIELVTLLSPRYPESLKEIDTPPLCLYCKGNTELLNTLGCAIVGTREITEYGKVVTKQFAKPIAEAGITIVSGLACGVDTIAHQTALDVEGSTIAVIAGGFNHVFPASNHGLYRKMIENNLVVTESKPNVTPSSFLFPTRNRIIAGLSRAVLITEAGERSGALHTKNYAVDYGREVFAIPGRITSEKSKGTNAIIKQCQASLVVSPTEILNFLGVTEKKNNKKPTIQLDMDEQTILNYILSEKKTYQEILDYTHFKPNQLNILLLNMQMKGLIEKLMGNSYIALMKV